MLWREVSLSYKSLLSFKEPDVGRIVIEEIPGKEQKSTRDVTRREVKDEVVKVRRSDITQVEPRAYTDRVDGARQVQSIKKIKSEEFSFKFQFQFLPF